MTPPSPDRRRYRMRVQIPLHRALGLIAVGVGIWALIIGAGVLLSHWTS